MLRHILLGTLINIIPFRVLNVTVWNQINVPASVVLLYQHEHPRTDLLSIIGHIPVQQHAPPSLVKQAHAGRKNSFGIETEWCVSALPPKNMVLST